MKRAKNHTRRIILTITAIALGAPVVLRLAGAMLPSLEMVTAQAAMVSAGIAMPEGGLSLIEKRFKDAIVSDDASSQKSNDNSKSGSQPADDSKADSQTASEEEPEEPVERPENAKDIVAEDFNIQSSSSMLKYGSGFLKNTTELSNAQVKEVIDKPLEMKLEKTDKPQVLIMHTHTTESYQLHSQLFYDPTYNARSTNDEQNMVSVGNKIEEQLKKAGIGVLHDTTKHDYPSYNGGYERSAETVKKYLKEYPTIQVVLDIHRDAIERDGGVRVKPVTEIDGKKAAQIMIIAGCDDGTMDMPNWDKNLRFAVALQDKCESMFPTLTRPIFFCYRKYNQDLTAGSLLIEMGGHANSLKEAQYSGEMVGKALAELLTSITK
ncbi:stage II sporulation protein P [Candidatus Soleaferrea massiliensis]|uniref:stage II sporulation protein P n=1 Tax=Candidatus Soleaferrea massiliensis TaxID=1470354 RepID=UPI0006944DD0|nr:stage II sporulation protein P [Candidatus Soleaferrea massiliensis]